MALYRVKQFFWALFAKIDFGDINFINLYLNSWELDLFNRLPRNEQKHCLKVAKDILQEYYMHPSEIKLDRNCFIKIALLHDIGKVERKINIYGKSIFVILDKLSNGKLKKFSNIKMINVYYNHGEIGYKILEKRKYDKRVLYLIRNHHNSLIKDDVELQVLMLCDSRN